MTLHRFFVPPSQIRGSTISLDDPQQIHHLRDVLRLGIGDQLMAFDGQGSQWLGTIARVGARRVVIQIQHPAQGRGVVFKSHGLRSDESPRSPGQTLGSTLPQRPLIARRDVEEMLRSNISGVSVWLGQALLKADRFEWVVQKATELGITRLSPLFTSRTVVRPHQFREAKLRRWQRIATEAAKQCRRATIPVIHPPQSLEALLRQVAAPACCDTPSAAWKVPPRSAQRASLILIPTLSVTAIPLQEVLSALPAKSLAEQAGRQAVQEVEPHPSAQGLGIPAEESRVATKGGQVRGAEPRTKGPAPRSLHSETHPGSPGAWVVALIGPEGDFSPEEVALAEKFGARPVSLGPLTLRAETAAIALLAILQHVLGS